jgi:hypothetical protein
MGGLEAGPVDLTEAPYAPWQKRVKALALLLIRGDKAQMNVDELRRGIEDLAPEDYDRLGYYERWTRSIADILTEKGLFTAEELTVKMAEVEKRWQEQGPK